LTPPAGSGFGQSTSAPSLSGLRQQAEQTRSEVGQTVASQVGTAASGVAEAGSVRVVFDNGQFLAWYRERFPIYAMLPKPRAGRP